MIKPEGGGSVNTNRIMKGEGLEKEISHEMKGVVDGV